MKKALLAAIIVAPSLCNSAIADVTFGVGLGSLYNGFGLNFGRTSDTTLMYGSLGCMGGSSSRSINTSGDVVTRDSSHNTNCGFGLGYISTSLLPGNNHGLGLNLGYTYDTDDFLGGSEYHVMPGYHYFFNGVGQRGLNLGLGVRATFTDEESTKTGLTFNLGYQF